MESIYWVFTHRCNQRCAHCYNNSRPGGPTLTYEEADAVLANLPGCNRLILSGGEPLVEKELLLHILRRAFDRYGSRTRLMLQTNGDLLDEEILDELLDCHVDHISVASQDRYHVRRKGQRERLEAMFRSRGLLPQEAVDPATHDGPGEPTYAFWGATPDLWLGGIWPRGRALRHGLWKRDPQHNFCAIWSGALGFLDDGSDRQEIAIQLTLAYPCCPGTLYPLGDVSRESLASILRRHRNSPVFEALNRGEPADMGLAQGVTREFAQKRIEELGSVCLWCDEFFAKYSRRNGALASKATPQPVALEAAGSRKGTAFYDDGE